MNINQATLTAAALIVVKNRSLLLAFSVRKQAWYLPGGKIDPGESAETALAREIQEELNCLLDPSLLTKYMHVSAPAFGEREGLQMEQDCFFYHSEIAPEANGEISALRYFNPKEYELEEHPVIGVTMVMTQLEKDGYI